MINKSKLFLATAIVCLFGHAQAEAFLDDYLYGDQESDNTADIAGIHWGHGIAFEVLGLATQPQAKGTKYLNEMEKMGPWFDYRAQVEIPITDLHLSLIGAYSGGLSRSVRDDMGDAWLKSKQNHWLMGAKYYFSSSNGIVPFISLAYLKQTNDFKPAGVFYAPNTAASPDSGDEEASAIGFTGHEDTRQGALFGFGAHLMMTDNSDFVLGAEIDGLDKMHPLEGSGGAGSTLAISHLHFFAGVSLHAGSLNN